MALTKRLIASIALLIALVFVLRRSRGEPKPQPEYT